MPQRLAPHPDDVNGGIATSAQRLRGARRTPHIDRRGSRRVQPTSGSEEDACTIHRHGRRTRDEQEGAIFRLRRLATSAGDAPRAAEPKIHRLRR
jgi:hypothetical protein